MLTISCSITKRALLLCVFLSMKVTAVPSEQITIMIGLDGLRADTIDHIDAPNLRRLANGGVRADMRPAMPSKTFVNFYSLATGLHPEHHGMVSNYPYDRKLARQFDRKRDVNNPYWWQGEPIWITAEKQGVKSAAYFWVGSEVAIDGIRPSYWKPYNQKKDYAERVQEVLQWFRQPEKQRPRLVMLYFSAVDTAAHKFGVGSLEEHKAVTKIDKHIGELITGLKVLGLYNKTNIVVVADHGMANLSDDRVINIDKWLDLSSYVVSGWNRNRTAVYAPFLNLYGNQTEINLAYDKLHNIHPNMRLIRRGQLPDNYHFDHPLRGPDLMLLADVGWTIYASRDKHLPKPLKQSGQAVATHGYDNYDPLMRATFIASGPNFKKALVAQPFDNIEVYGLLACSLGLTPAKTDGNITHVKNMLTIPCEKE